MTTDARATAIAMRRPSAGRDQLASLSTTLDSRLGRETVPLRRQHDEREEREEPRKVEVEPVGQDELEADQKRGGERRELEWRLAPGQEVDRDRAHHEQAFEHTLEQVQIREPGVVLAPVPDRERRIAPDLRPERAVVEDARGVERVRLEQEDREHEQGRDDERRREDELRP